MDVCERVGEDGEREGVFLGGVCVSGGVELGECGDGGGEGECEGWVDGDLVWSSLIMAIVELFADDVMVMQVVPLPRDLMRDCAVSVEILALSR